MTSILKVSTIQNTAGGAPTAADLGLNVTGSVIQVVTYLTNQTLSGNIAYSNTVLTATDGTTWGSFSFTPKFSNSKILFQTSTISCNESANQSDGFWAIVTDGTTLFAKTASTVDYTSWQSSLNAAFISFNHAFDSWGTTTKSLQVRFGNQGGGQAGFQNVNYNSAYGNSLVDPSSREIGITIMEIAG
jgi:hypothetical protein